MLTQLSPNLKNEEAKEPTLLDRIFRDRDGKIVIGQLPNLPSLLGITLAVLQFFLPASTLQTALALIAFGTLYTWAWQELFEGVNYFRRGLGLVSLVGLIVLGLSSTT